MSSLHPARAVGVTTTTRSYQKSKMALCAAMMAIGLIVTPASLQAASAAIVHGRVQNAANGMYLGKARVVVEGTNIETFTNDFGEYVLDEVPAGKVKLVVTYTGQQPQTVELDVKSGENLTQDVSFNKSGVVTNEDGSVVLGEFVVQSQRFKNAQEIASNEERYSTTIKNVVSADMFGDIAEGNVGEFVKFLPGVLVEYGGQAYSNPYDATGISIRGFGAADTAITLDGVPIANATPASLTRQIGLDMMSINNASRVEIIKVATPDMPANSIGGAVNLISKSAFEYVKPTITWRVFATFDSKIPVNQLDEKTPGPSRNETRKLQPGWEFTYALPVNKKFGVTLTASSANQYNLLQRAESTWQANSMTLVGDRPWTGNNPVSVTGGSVTTPTTNPTIVPTTVYNAAGNAADVLNPALTKIQITDNPRMSNRNSASIKFDWKPGAGHLLTGKYQVSKYDSVDVSHRFSFTAGKPKDWSPDYTTGLQYRANAPTTVGQVYPNVSTPTIPWTATSAWATSGNGRVSGTQGGNAAEQTVDARDREGITHTVDMTYKYKKRGWDIGVTGSYSLSDGRAVDGKNGHFSKVEMKMDPGLVNFYDIKDGVPGRVEVYRRPTTAETPLTTATFATQNDAYNAFYTNPANLIDYTKLGSWVTNNFKGFSADSYSESQVGMYKIDVRKDIDFLPRKDLYTLAIKVGTRHDMQQDRKWGRGTGFGRSLKPGMTTLASSTYLDDSYINKNPGFGFAPMEWADAYKLYALDQDFGLFADTDAVYSDTREGWDKLADADLLVTNADARSNYASWVNQQKKIRETKTAYYIQLEGKTLKNRLSFVGGARREDSKREGYQPWTDTKWNFVRYADGTVFKETVGGINYSKGVAFNSTFSTTDPRTNLFAPDSNVTAAAARDALKARLNALGLYYPTVVIPTASLRGAMMRLNPSKAIHAEVEGKPSFSSSFAYEVTDRLIARVSWSRSFGQVKLEDSAGGLISGSASTVNIEQYDLPGNPDESISATAYREYTTGSTLSRGKITTGNPNLKPWTSDNFDYSLSYHHKFGGKMTLTYYTKTVKDVHNSLILYQDMPLYTEVLKSLGIDFDINDANDPYRDWTISTSINGEGIVKTHGYEADIQQNFSFLGGWGRHFNLFASYTAKKTTNPQITSVVHPSTGQRVSVTPATVASSADKSSGAGLNFDSERLTISVKATFRNEALTDGTSTALYQGTSVKLYDRNPAEVRLDTSLNYRITKKYSFFVNGRDVLNSERKTIRYDDAGVYPEYARRKDIKEFGVQVNFGIKGEF